jgi:hypothetical protein
LILLANMRLGLGFIAEDRRARPARDNQYAPSIEGLNVLSVTWGN